MFGARSHVARRSKVEALERISTRKTIHQCQSKWSPYQGQYVGLLLHTFHRRGRNTTWSQSTDHKQQNSTSRYPAVAISRGKNCCFHIRMNLFVPVASCDPVLLRASADHSSSKHRLIRPVSEERVATFMNNKCSYISSLIQLYVVHVDLVTLRNGYPGR